MPLTVKRHKKSKVIKHTNKKKVRKQHSKLATIQLTQLSQVWDDRKSAKKNLSEMGLSYDSNVAVRHSRKSTQRNTKLNSEKANTAVALETEAKAPRVIKFRFPKAQALYFSYLVSKYGDDYKAMSKDPKNIYQETWKQIRAKIMKFNKLKQYGRMTAAAR